MRALALSLLFLLPACGKSTTTTNASCDPDVAAQALAGSGATDCGTVGRNADQRTVDECTASALEGGRAFRAHYELQGTDSAVARIIVGAADGKVYFMTYDSDPAGGGGAHPVINQSECVGPKVTVTGNARAISCTTQGERLQTCP